MNFTGLKRFRGCGQDAAGTLSLSSPHPEIIAGETGLNKMV